MTKKVELNIAGITFRREAFDRVTEEHNPLKDFEVALEREPDNQYDANAIKVLVDGIHLGYIPATSALGLAPVMDNGVNIGAEMVEIGTFEKQQKNGKMKILPYARINLILE